MKKEYILVFISGMTLMSIEMLGIRIFPPYFGYSIHVWGCIIGTILISMSLGYYIGGKLSSKKGILKIITILTTFFLILSSVFYKNILDFFQKLPLITGSVLSSIVLFLPSMFAISMITPTVIGKLSKEKDSGSITGMVFAVSNIGSVLGIFITSFFLIPTIGTKISLLLFSGIFLLTTLIYNIKDKRILLIFLLVSFFFIHQKEDGRPFEVIESRESKYNLIKVLRSRDDLLLITENENWAQTVRFNRNIPNYYSFYGDIPVLNNASDILMLGLGAGESVVQIKKNFPDTSIDGVEIDPEIVELGKKYFQMGEIENLNIIIEDARRYVFRTEKNYDIIYLDVYKYGPNIPYYVVTKEFFSECNNHLNNGGIFVTEVPNFKPLMEDVSTTLSTSFDYVYVVYVSQNYVIISSNEPIEKSEISGFQLEEFGGNGFILTDDKSNIEMTTFDYYKYMRKSGPFNEWDRNDW